MIFKLPWLDLNSKLTNNSYKSEEGEWGRKEADKAIEKWAKGLNRGFMKNYIQILYPYINI